MYVIYSFSFWRPFFQPFWKGLTLFFLNFYWILQVGAITPQSLEVLLQSIHDCLSSSDWVTRKAAADTLCVLAMHPSYLTTEGAVSTLNMLEACRMDKVSSPSINSDIFHVNESSLILQSSSMPHIPAIVLCLSFFYCKDFVIWSLKILAQLPAFINNVLELEINLPIFWVEVESIILLVFKCLSHIWFLIISQPDAWSKLWFSIIYLTMDTFILTFHDSDMMMLKKVVMQSFNIFHNWPSSRALKILIDSYCDTSMSLLSWYMENGSALESFISFPLLFFILIYLCFFFK